MTGILKKFWKSDKSRTFAQAMELYNNRHYEEASRIFEAMLAEKKSSSDVYCNLAAVYCSQSYHHLGFRDFLQGQYGRACEKFEKAIELQPGQLDLYLFIGICRNNMRDYEEAAEAFRLLLSLDKTRPSTRIMQGIVLHNLGHWESSVHHHRAILREQPGYPDIHFRQGQALVALDRLHEARESFRRALALNPDYREALIKTALIDAHFGNGDEADGLIARAAARNPDDIDVHYAQGAMLFDREDWTGAAAAFVDVLRLSPEDINGAINLALSFVSRGNLEKATDILNDLRKRRPQDKRFEQAAAILEKMRQFPADYPRPLEALRPYFRSTTLLDNIKREISRHVDIAPDFEDVVKLVFSLPESDCHLCRPFLNFIEEYTAKNPEYPDLYYSLGLLYIRLRQDAEGERALRAALMLNPRYLKARLSLFSFLKERRRDEAALLEGKMLLSETTPGPDFYTDMAEICLRRNETERSLGYALEARKQNGGYARAWLAEALALEKLGREAEAAAALQACLAASPDPDVTTEALALQERMGGKQP